MKEGEAGAGALALHPSAQAVVGTAEITESAICFATAFPFQGPFCVLVSYPLLAPSWVKGFLNKKIPTNLLLQGASWGGDSGKGSWG